MEEANSPIATTAPDQPLPQDLSGKIRKVKEIVQGFLRGHTAYDILPQSGKVLILDSEIQLSEAVEISLRNHCMKAVVWDSAGRRFLRTMTLHDALNLSFQFALQRQEDVSLQEWSRGAGIVQVRSTDSLLEAADLMKMYRIHGVAVHDEDEQMIVGFITMRQIHNFLLENLLGDPIAFDISLEALPELFSELNALDEESSVEEAIQALFQNEVDAVPLMSRQQGTGVGGRTSDGGEEGNTPTTPPMPEQQHQESETSEVNTPSEPSSLPIRQRSDSLIRMAGCFSYSKMKLLMRKGTLAEFLDRPVSELHDEYDKTDFFIFETSETLAQIMVKLYHARCRRGFSFNVNGACEKQVTVKGLLEWFISEPN